MYDVLKEIYKIGIVPVIALEDGSDAYSLARALCEGGLSCAEVTFRTAAAEESIRIMTEKFPQMLVGAGTVLTIEQVDRAIAAGAKFIVSPGLNPRVVKYCIDKSITIIPGCSSPSDMEVALELGLDTVKFFPAEASGGLSKIKAMSAPYGNIKFMPTGGITAKNLTSYLDFDKIIACGGSWMVNKNLLQAKDFDGIKRLTREAVTSMLGFRLKHVGINTNTAEEAESIATSFESIFGFTKKVGNSSIFAANAIEVMKNPYLGLHGHIGIETNYVERAVYHLETQGCTFDYSTAKYDSNNKMIAIYLKGEIGGFAVHLVQK